ncbi:unnamed protein product [Ilex paraguariensis]|uniref:Glycerol-3-phosphate dehydrogenase [NAD(+)] n=1 Tax=Ilex paraguariensis TaxID=185542 RepID=A0ABC8SK27_9AQUA
MESALTNPLFPKTQSVQSPHNLGLVQKFPSNPNSVLVLHSSSNYSGVCMCFVDETVKPLPPPSQNPDLISDTDPVSTTEHRRVVRLAWEKLVRWSRSWQSKAATNDVLGRTNKVVVLGGGSFGTAMAAHVANRKAQLEVSMLVRDPQICQSINEKHCNCKYFPEHILPENVTATADAKAALLGADFCLHAIPVQFSSSFLKGIADCVDPSWPFISLSKGLELDTLRMMSQIIPQSLRNPCQPDTHWDENRLSNADKGKKMAMVVASKDKQMANAVQQLLASKNLRISTSSDVTGVEIAGALKNVLAIAAGIVEGMNLGNNSMAALVAQVHWYIRRHLCYNVVLDYNIRMEIEYLILGVFFPPMKMGAKWATMTGLAGYGDIRLTCFVNLSRNRTVGVRLGSGEKLDDIL